MERNHCVRLSKQNSQAPFTPTSARQHNARRWDTTQHIRIGKVSGVFNVLDRGNLCEP